MEATYNIHWIEVIVTIICAVLGSSGLWAIIQKRNEKKDFKTRMLLGLAHDRIMALGMGYVERGCITKDEYENLVDYLYAPYEGLGGNGSAARVVEECKRLPLCSDIKCDTK